MTIDDFNRAYPVHKAPPAACWCGAENRQADDHICGECAEHCELAAHREGRESPRDVELRRLRNAPCADPEHDAQFRGSTAA